MDENCYWEAEYTPLQRKEINRSEFTFFCKRPTQKAAKLISDDLIKQGKKAVVTQGDGGFEVWWG